MAEDLTYMQRVAMRGEIGKLVSTYDKHDEDVPFMCFLAFAIYDLDLFDTVKSTLCEFIDKTIVDKVSYYVQSCIVPYDIWCNKIISDIKWLVGQGMSDEENHILRSIFCNYINRVKDTSNYACHYLLNKVLADKELELLHEDAFYLRSNISLPVKVKLTKDGKSEEAIDAYRKESAIFSISFMSTNPLSFEDATENIETKEMEEINKDLEKDENEDIYANLRESFSDANENTYFLVEKKDIDTGKRVSVRHFVGIEEVIQYLQSVANVDPNIQSSYQFVVIEAEISE